MLAVQLIGRLLPHAEASLNISSLLQQAHRLGPEHCALGDQALGNRAAIIKDGAKSRHGIGRN